MSDDQLRILRDTLSIINRMLLDYEQRRRELEKKIEKLEREAGER